MNLAEQLLHALKRRGATEVFGIPGDFALPLFREIERSAVLPLLTLSHEPAVGFAADAASRARGGLGVAAVTYGAGALNLVNAVAGAYAERVPLVVLSGAPAAHEAASGYLLHHQVKTLDSQWRLMRELTVDQAGNSRSLHSVRPSRPLARPSQARPKLAPRPDSRVIDSNRASCPAASSSLSVIVPGVTTRTTLRSTGPLAVATSPTCSAIATDSPSLTSLAR